MRATRTARCAPCEHFRCNHCRAKQSGWPIAGTKCRQYAPLIRHDGKTWTMAALAAELGVTPHKSVDAKLVAGRLKNGKDVVWALTEPRMTSSQAATLGAKVSHWRHTPINARKQKA